LHLGGRNCCQFIPEVLFEVLYCAWLLYIHPALEIAPDEQVAGMEIDLAGHSLFPLSVIT